MEMLVLTLIATLSLSIVYALDQGKGSLFPVYFYAHRGLRASALAMGIANLGVILPFLLLFVQVHLYRALSLALIVVVLNHAVVKALVGNLFHYTGSFRPSVTSLGKWYAVNYVLSAEPLYILLIASLGSLPLLVFVSSSLSLRLVAWTTLISRRNEGIRRLTMINYDRVNFVTSILLILSVLLKGVN